MSQTQELATVPEKAPIALGNTGVQLGTFDEMARFCLAVSKSRLAPKGFETPEAIMVAIQHGMEIGLKPMQALQSVCVINGRPSVYGDAALALVQAHPACEDVVETWDEKGATCSVKRKGRSTVTRSFTIDDAKRARLWGKAGPWTEYPRRMLQMRARSWALRDAFPDALKGVGIAEEVRDYPAREKVLEKVKLVMPDEKPETPELPPVSVEAADQDGAIETVNPDTGEFEWSAK